MRPFYKLAFVMVSLHINRTVAKHCTKGTLGKFSFSCNASPGPMVLNLRVMAPLVGDVKQSFYSGFLKPLEKNRYLHYDS